MAAGTMYRTLLAVLLCTIAASAAPQDTVNSDITYVKIQPATDIAPPASLRRESRIENLPLTIPGNVTRSSPEKTNLTKRESNSVRPFVIDEKAPDKTDTIEEKQPDNTRKIRSEDSTANYEADTVEPTETTTETLEDVTHPTENYETRTKAPSPRFISKLSYFKKDDEVRSSIATNLVEMIGKRRFKSKCRCEKIWNCPKLQITVPRCPNEYFLCCF